MTILGNGLFLVTCLLVSSANAFLTTPPSSIRGKFCILPQPTQPCLGLPSASSGPIRLRAAGVALDHPSTKTNPFTKMERKRRLATGMAFLTGVADLAFVLKYKSFATMMTGNTMWMALALVEQRYMDFGFYASVIASYVSGISLFRLLNLNKKEKAMPLYAFIVATLFVGSDVVFKMYQSRWIPMIMLATGFGLANSVGQETTGTLTFVITGHMTRLANQIVDRYSKTAGRKKFTLADQQTLVQNSAVIGGFFAGAAVSGILKAKGILVDKIGVFSAIGLTYAGLFLWKDMESLGGAWWKRKDKAMLDLDDDGQVVAEPGLIPSNLPNGSENKDS
eukprot:scaffold5966_cov118-Cylindrotheca_fusiformis.AAC.6